MKLVFVLCLLSILCNKQLYGKEQNKNHEVKCEGVLVRNKFHKKQILGKGLNRPYQLAYDQSEHKIFFSYNKGSDDEDTFEIGYIEKNHTEHEVLEQVENGFAIAIDNKDNVIYYGGSNGIYKQHFKGNNTKIENIIKDNIWDMFFKHHLYFVSFPSQHLFKYEESKAERQKHIHEKIYQFVIDGSNDIFITTNESGLIHIKNGTNERVSYSGPKIFRAMEINNEGVAYFAGQNGIYVANKKEKTLEKIVHIKNIFGLTFDDKDNIIYSDSHEIIKLVPEECPKADKHK